MGLFGGKPRQLKNLDGQLTAARLSFGMFSRLPAANQQILLERAPADVAEAVRAAVRAGHGADAGQMLAAADASVPAGATEEQWRSVVSAGRAAL